MHSPAIVILLAVLMVPFARPVSILFHELGHALIALVVTRQNVIVYLGSYGETDKCGHFKIGKLEFWWKYRVYSWNAGLCLPTAKSVSINRQMLYTLAGPLASLALSVITCWVMFAVPLHEGIIIFLVFLLGATAYDFGNNLRVHHPAMKMPDGTLLYSDGNALLKLFAARKYPKEYPEAIQFFNDKKFAQAAEILDRLIAGGLNDPDLYRLTVSAYLLEKKYLRVKEIAEHWVTLGEMNADDFTNVGVAHSRLGLHDEAMEFYNKSLVLDPAHKYSLNNKGYALNCKEKYIEAIPFFDRVIEIDVSFAHAYNNRGLAKIKTGRTEEGLKEIHHSLTLDGENAYCFFHLGIYHLDRGESAEALILLNKAKNMDHSILMIDELILRAETHK